jgi:formamidopyrimidine-DNA glycosylase
MPELPEVITIRNDLRNVVLKKKIVNIDTHDNYPLNPSPEEFNKYVLDHRITEIENIAKLLLLKMSSGKYIAVHLRMTGNLLYNFDDKYKKITLQFEDDSKLHFSTIRKFGFFEVWDKKDKDSYASRQGKTALESNLEPDEFISLIRKKKTNIKTALLDQKLISGIGNIYANDALYLAKIHPLKSTQDLTNSELKLLFNKLQTVLKEGIKNRGSSIDRFVDVYGRPGSHQDYFYVYGKKGKICTQCEDYSIEYLKIQGRGTFYCPGCQPRED